VTERPATIQTERLDLVVLLPEDVEALIAGDFERARLLTGVTFPDGWPNDPEAKDGLAWHLRALRNDHAQVPWRIRAIVERSSGVVVGSINLKGPPGQDGDVEVGWGLVEQARGRGYAAEASAAVVAWVAAQPEVASLSATVPDDNLPSRRLAARLGLARTEHTRRGLPLWTRRLTSKDGVGVRGM
jgi:RimJ/RimL family protein N-acetyltransferase